MQSDTIYLNVLAGFANRLRALISGICLAEDLGKKLVIIWKPNWTCNISIHECFDMKTLPVSYNETMQTENFMKIFTYDFNTSPFMIESYGAFYNAYTPQWYGHLRKIRFLQQPTIDPSTIGIHIRRTDNRQSILHSTNEYFIEQIKKEIENNPQAQFYLATDCEKTKEIILNNFKNRIITQNFVLYRDTKEGMLNSLNDFLSLSLCSKILGSYRSSYGEIAAAYGNKPLIMPSVVHS